MHRKPKTREVVLIFGKTGTGKSFFANKFLWNYSRVAIIDPMQEYEGLKCFDLEEVEKFTRYSPHLFRVCLDRPDLAEAVFSWGYNRGDMVIAVEEAQRVLPGGSAQIPEPILDAIYRGRHVNLSIVIIAQRASTVNIHVRSQWTRIIAFRQTEPDDIKYIMNQTGERLDLAALPPWHYFDITPTGVTLRKPI